MPAACKTAPFFLPTPCDPTASSFPSWLRLAHRNGSYEGRRRRLHLTVLEHRVGDRRGLNCGRTVSFFHPPFSRV
jgi:hypothetical protein